MNTADTPQEKMLTYPLRKLIKFFIPEGREDQGCKLDDEDLATLISLIDKDELVHVEFPSEFSSVNYPTIWYLKAWKASQIANEKKRANRQQEMLEIDNYKHNIALLSKCLASISGMTPTECIPLARQTLLNRRITVDKLAATLKSRFGVDIKLPFYRKEFHFINTTPS